VTRVAISDAAAADIERVGDFLLDTLPHEAVQTAEIIFGGLEILVRHPEIGRSLPQGQRELVISRGRSGYVALYAYDVQVDIVTIHRVRHQREQGYDH
jgi:plasmid stabilization system protein ParE